MIACPNMNQNEIAAQLGYTPPYLSTLVTSDAFQLKLQMRRMEYEAALDQTALERLHDLDAKATAIIASELEKAEADPNFALSVKKTVQTNMSGARRQQPANHTTVIANNAQVNQGVLARAREKMRRVEDRIGTDNFVETILEPTG
jgi:hypothetical protein